MKQAASERTPESRQDWLQMRAKNINSTEVAALFGCSPYLTKFALWHSKKSGEIVEIEANERMKWGTRLQDSIAAGIAEDNGWKVKRADNYFEDARLRVGTSLDYIVTEGAGIDGPTVLEIKNVDSLAFRDGWVVDGDDIEAPLHIEFQIQHQLFVTGYESAYIAALVGGNRVVLLKRERDEAAIAAIENACAEFWKSIDANDPPEPVFPQDAKAVVDLYQFATPEKIVLADEAVEQLAAQYRDLGRIEKEAAETRESIKARILMAMGDAEKCKGMDFTISAGIVGPARVEYDRDPYRAFRISWKKQKQGAGASMHN